MKRFYFLVIAAVVITPCSAQIAGDFLLAAHADLIKSDNDGFFEKIQVSAEVDYFISRKLTATVGGEFWTDNEAASLVLGARWYPIQEAFIRARGLIGSNEVSLGGGWAKPLNQNWNFEAIGDVYSGGHIAIRAGFSYIIRRKGG